MPPQQVAALRARQTQTFPAGPNKQGQANQESVVWTLETEEEPRRRADEATIAESRAAEQEIDRYPVSFPNPKWPNGPVQT